MELHVAGYGYDYEGYTVVGVFSSEEKAKKFLAENYKGTGDYHHTEEMFLDEGQIGV